MAARRTIDRMSSPRRRVAVGSDMRHETADAVAAHLDGRGVEVVRCGAVDGPDTPWPDVAEAVGRLVALGVVEQAVLLGWAGAGVSIAANKIPGVRAALCGDPETARGARRWNDANVLALGLSTTDEPAATAIVDAWLDRYDVDPEEAVNVARVAKLEERYRVGPLT